MFSNQWSRTSKKEGLAAAIVFDRSADPGEVSERFCRCDVGECVVHKIARRDSINDRRWFG